MIVPGGSNLGTRGSNLGTRSSNLGTRSSNLGTRVETTISPHLLSATRKSAGRGSWKELSGCGATEEQKNFAGCQARSFLVHPSSMRQTRISPIQFRTLLIVAALVAGCGGEAPSPQDANPGSEEGAQLSPFGPDEDGPGFEGLALSRPGGFKSPLPSVPTYTCKYASAGGVTYTTLWADNEDGGAKAKTTPGYAGSLCDAYDNITGSKYNGQFCGSHPGVDLAVASGTSIFAIGAGTVFKVDTVGAGGWGKHVVLQLNVFEGGAPVTIYVTYAHLSSVAAGVILNAAVAAGQKLGATGNTGNSTGPHLHFQIDKAAPIHPYWPNGAPNTPDFTGTLKAYTYNPLTSIGFGTCL